MDPGEVKQCDLAALKVGDWAERTKGKDQGVKNEVFKVCEKGEIIKMKCKSSTDGRNWRRQSEKNFRRIDKRGVSYQQQQQQLQHGDQAMATRLDLAVPGGDKNAQAERAGDGDEREDSRLDTSDLTHLSDASKADTEAGATESPGRARDYQARSAQNSPEEAKVSGTDGEGEGNLPGP